MATIDISVIIPSRHREPVLWKTVENACEAIANCTNTEVIVVNDGDTPLELPGQYAGKVHLYNNLSKGVSAARNIGAQHAKGQLLFFIDDDMWITQAAVAWITALLQKPGALEAVYNINWVFPSGIQQKLVSTKIGQYLLRSSYDTMWGRMKTPGTAPAAGLYAFNMIMSGSFLISKTIFEKTGRYNEGMIFQGEDTDMAAKLNKLGIAIYCVFDVTLFHNQQDRFDVKGFLSRVQNGYASEFRAVQAGLIPSAATEAYQKMPGKLLFELFRVSEKGWLFLLQLLPNWSMVRPLNNKLIGTLSGLQRYKEWRKNVYL